MTTERAIHHASSYISKYSSLLLSGYNSTSYQHRVSIELSDRFELSDTIHDQSMPGIHTNDVAITHSILILALKMMDSSFLNIKLDNVR